MMEFKNQWTDIETAEAENIFTRWWRSNLEVCDEKLHNSTERTFGMPYTSSGICAEESLDCNCEAFYKYIPSYHAVCLRISIDGFVYVILWDKEENELLIPIGKVGD